MLTDEERIIILPLALLVPIEKRDAFVQSVETTLCQCLRPRNVHKVAAEELRRFTHPPKRQRALYAARTRHV